MSQKTVQLYDELESFIKEETSTHTEERTLIAKLNEYARELRREGEEQAKNNNLSAVIEAADKARARGFEEGKNQGYIEGYSNGRHDGGTIKAYEDGVKDGRRQAQDFIDREKAAKESALKKSDEYYKIAVRSSDKLAEEKAKAYDKGWKDGFESGDENRRAVSNSRISNSLRDLIETSIENHGGDDEKIVSDIEAHFTKMMSKAQHVTDGKPTRYRAKWLIGLAFMRAIGRDIKEKDSQTAAKQEEYALELASELLGAIDKDKQFIIGKKLTGKSGDRVICDDVIGEALKTKPWTDVEKSLPAYGEPVRVTFDINDPKGEEDSEYFSVAKLIRHEGADHWEYQSGIGGRYPLAKASVKGWRYVWVDIKKSTPTPGDRVDVKLRLNGENIEVKNVSVGYDNGLYFDYSQSDWREARMCSEFGGNVKVYLKSSAVTHWRYMAPVRALGDQIDWKRMADNQPPLNVWVEAKTDHPQAVIQRVRRQYRCSAAGNNYRFYFDFKDGSIVEQDLCCLTQWRYI